MMIETQTRLFTKFLGTLFEDRLSKAVAFLKAHRNDAGPEAVRMMLRLAIRQPSGSTLDYLQLYNLWTGLERPALKPNVAGAQIQLLTDFTATNLPPYLELFCAGWGVNATVRTAAYDSVEQDAFNPSSSLYKSGADIVVVCLSEHWLRRYLGTDPLVSLVNYDRLESALSSILQAIEENSTAQILVTNFPGSAYARPAGLIATDDRIGLSMAIMRLNHWLVHSQSDRRCLVDLASALFLAGGQSTIGTTNYLRAKMAFEPAGCLAVTRAMAAAIAHLCGKSYRAVVTDWDNTLWGGDVAEVGSHGIVCSLDSPDGLAYRMVQEYLQGVKSLGILLAAASRNNPSVAAVWDENRDMVLGSNDFASMQIGFQPKSDAITQISNDLGFGSEYMVFLDDNPFELAQVLSAHPYLDLLRAGPEPEQTLATLSSSEIGAVVYLSSTDLQREEQAQQLRDQRKEQATFSNITDFLQSIHIRLTVSLYDEQNKMRVLQMLRKSNQFNLTTRRHDDAALAKMQQDGAQIVAFSYDDSFGPQGVIAVVILLTTPDGSRIESWVMSCRVLNRTVEQAIFAWLLDTAGPGSLTGECIPTEKNRLVQDLYPRLGFNPVGKADPHGGQYWLYTPSADNLRPEHFAQIEDLCTQPSLKGS